MTPLDKLRQARLLIAEAADDLYISLHYGGKGAPEGSAVAHLQRVQADINNIILALTVLSEGGVALREKNRAHKQGGTPPDKH